MILPQPDLAAERAVLGGICKHGKTAWIDIADIVSSTTFTDSSNQIIFKVFEECFERGDYEKIDLPGFLSQSASVGFASIFERQTEIHHLRSIFNVDVEPKNIRAYAAKIRKIELGRELAAKISKVSESIGGITGNETITEIFNMVEGPLLQISASEESGGATTHIWEGIDEHLDYLIENPVDIVGISTGYPLYDIAIGGGLMEQELDIIAARMKVGKSFLGDNIGIHIARQGIPVLNCDTEMSKKQHWYRILANLSGVDMNEIKTGKFGSDPIKKDAVLRAKEEFKTLPYFWECIGGKPFEEVLSIIRRWVIQHVGLKDDGKANQCVLIYDYIKLLSADGITSGMQEFQALGFLVTSLKNLLIRYDIPCLAFAQLNRDGVTKESTDVLSGSDRILMYCSSCAIYKHKSPEELAADGGRKNGNMKLVPLIARNGPGIDDGNYINMLFEGSVGRITQLKTKFDLELEKQEIAAFETTDDFVESEISEV